MPGSTPPSDPSNIDAHGLLGSKPFPNVLQKQTTGRNDKENFKKGSSSVLALPSFGFARGLTRQEGREDNDDQDRETIDPKLAVTSIKSITRPSNVSGMASEMPASSHHDGDDEDRSVHLEFDMRKPSVQVEEFGIIDRTDTAISVPASDSKQDKTDNKSNKSFKTKDSKIVVDVETSIQILDPKKKNQNGTVSPENATEKKKYLGDRK